MQQLTDKTQERTRHYLRTLEVVCLYCNAVGYNRRRKHLSRGCGSTWVYQKCRRCNEGEIK